jgi:hypothetical protein
MSPGSGVPPHRMPSWPPGAASGGGYTRSSGRRGSARRARRGSTRARAACGVGYRPAYALSIAALATLPSRTAWV